MTEAAQAPNKAPIEASIRVEAEPRFVWHVLVSRDTVPLWLGALEYAPQDSPFFYIQTDAAKRAAGDVSGASQCKIVEAVAPERFTFVWHMAGGQPLAIHFNVAAEGEGAQLSVLVHGFERYAAEDVGPLRAAHERQWVRKTLPALKAAAEHAASDPVNAGVETPDSS